jgi:hypothetical protein
MPKRYFAMPKPTLQPARMNDRTHRIKKTDGAALPAGILPPFRPAQLRRLCKAQFALPTVPGRLIGRSSRSVRAALHDAEMADWQASGGDYLNSHLATVFVRV